MALVGLWSVLDVTIEFLHGSNVVLLVDGLLRQCEFEFRTWFDEDIVDAWIDDDEFCS